VRPPSQVRFSGIPVEVACSPLCVGVHPPLRLRRAALIGLRYRIEVRGLDAVKRKGRSGILFLPNHASLLDPAFIVAHLFPAFNCVRSPTSTRSTDRVRVHRPALRSRILPNLERSGASARDRTRQALQEIAEGLKAGENILLYPLAA